VLGKLHSYPLLHHKLVSFLVYPMTVCLCFSTLILYSSQVALRQSGDLDNMKTGRHVHTQAHSIWSMKGILNNNRVSCRCFSQMVEDTPREMRRHTGISAQNHNNILGGQLQRKKTVMVWSFHAGVDSRKYNTASLSCLTHVLASLKILQEAELNQHS